MVQAAGDAARQSNSRNDSLRIKTEGNDASRDDHIEQALTDSLKYF